MLKLVIAKSDEFYDEAKEEFITYPEVVLELEHSLVSLAEWESKWEKPFLGLVEKTEVETLDYVKTMVIGDYPEEVLDRLTPADYNRVSEYINAKMTATWFAEDTTSKPSSEVITAEIIYYWLVSLNIAFECQTWHLNRLLTLIKVCNKKNSPPEKISRQDLIARNQALNEQRKAQLKTKG